MTRLSALMNPRADGQLGDALILSAASSSIGNLGYKHAYEFAYIATDDYVIVSTANGASMAATELAFNYEADSTYLIDGMLLYQTSLATIGIGAALDCSTSVTTCKLVGVSPLTAAGAVTGLICASDGVYSCPLTGCAAVDTTYPIIINGMLITGSSAGTCTLRFKPEKVEKRKVTLKKHSTITVRKVV